MECLLSSLVLLSNNWLLAHRIHQATLSHGFHKSLQGYGTYQSLCGFCGIQRHHYSSDILQLLLLSNCNYGKSGSWGGARSKVEGGDYELDQMMFLNSYLLKLYLKRKRDITEFFPDMIVFFYGNNSHFEIMG